MLFSKSRTQILINTYKIHNMLLNLSYDIIYQINTDAPFEIKKDGHYYLINKKKYEGMVRGNKGFLKKAFGFSNSNNSRPSIWFEVKEGNPRLMIMSIQAGNRAIFFLLIFGLFNLISVACAILGTGTFTYGFIVFFLVFLFFDIFFLAGWTLLVEEAKSSAENDFKKEFKLKKISEKGTYKIRMDF